MKKILSLLIAITLTASGTSSVVSCGSSKPSKPKTNSDQKKANEIAKTLKNKSIILVKDPSKTKANQYSNKIQEEINGIVSQTPTAYSFEFATTAEGDKALTLAYQDFTIKIKVGSAISDQINIKIKLAVSDLEKANSIAIALNNESIDFEQVGSKTKAKDYATEIQAKLNRKVSQTPTAYSFEFSTAEEGEKTLSKTNTLVNIQVIVKGTHSTAVASINIKFMTDLEKANMIATTLRNASINPINIKLNINNNKQKISDYFQSDIKAKLDTKLTDEEKTFDYSLVNNQNIINIFQDFYIKIKVGDDTSTVEFTIMIQFNYTNISDLGTNEINAVQTIGTGASAKIYVGTNKGLYISSDSIGTSFKKVGNLGTKTIFIIQKIGSKIYLGTYSGLYVSSDGTSFSQVSGDLGTKTIYTIKQIGTGANAKIYVGTLTGLYVSNDGTGSTFTKVSGDLGANIILAIQQIGTGANAKIYVGTDNNGLWASSDATGTSFSKISSTISNISIIKQIGTGANAKIYVGTNEDGLYVSADNGANFTKVNDLGTKSIRTIQQINITASNSKIYVGTIKNGLYISSDDGTSFTQVSSIPNNTRIELVTQINNKIYVGTYNGLYVSSDGTSFTQVSNLGTKTIYTIKQVGSKIYAGTTVGLYYNFIS